MSSPPDPQSLFAFQQDFANRVRNPDNNPLPSGLPGRRMAIYEELLFNNLHGFVSASFPITLKIQGETSWQQTIRRFFSEHSCQSPLFRDIAGEFLDWSQPLQNQLFPQQPWLWEFMHYEWLELAAEVAADLPDDACIDPQGDLLTGIPLLASSVQTGCYHYEVHRISPEWQPQAPAPHPLCYLVMRNAADEIHFSQLSPASAQLIELLDDQTLSGRQAVLALGQQMNLPDPQTLLEPGAEMLQMLLKTGVILGTRCTHPRQSAG
jgi:hypothetical protein